MKNRFLGDALFVYVVVVVCSIILYIVNDNFSSLMVAIGSTIIVVTILLIKGIGRWVR